MRIAIALSLFCVPAVASAQLAFPQTSDQLPTAPPPQKCAGCLTTAPTSGTWQYKVTITGPSVNGALTAHESFGGTPGPKGAVVTSMQVTQNSFNYCTLSGPTSTNCALTDYTFLGLNITGSDGESRTFTV